MRKPVDANIEEEDLTRAVLGCGSNLDGAMRTLNEHRLRDLRVCCGGGTSIWQSNSAVKLKLNLNHRLIL
jgi:hypothetical protein